MMTVTFWDLKNAPTGQGMAAVTCVPSSLHPLPEGKEATAITSCFKTHEAGHETRLETKQAN